MERGSDSDAGVTYEWALWVLVALLALAMRLAQLDVAPLTGPEAREAMLAWRAATGAGRPLGDYNPVLLAGNSLLFALFGGGDGVARLLPVLFGTGLALTPALFGRHLGRIGALASGLYLAVSPTALVASRQLDGTMIASFAAVGFVGSLVRFWETDRRGWLVSAGVALGLALTGGTAAYGVLLPLGLAYAILSVLPLEGHLPRLNERFSRIGGDASWFFGPFAAALLLFATGFGWNAAGLGAAGGMLASWIRRFRPVASGGPGPLTVLSVYEVLGVVLGVGGLVWGVQERRPAAVLLGLWAGLAVLVLSVMPGRMVTDTVWAVLPLAMLVGLVAETLALKRWRRGIELRLVHLAIVWVLWAYAYLMLARYSAYGDRADLLLVVVTIVLQGLVGLSFELVLGGGASLRTAAAGTATALLSLTLAAGWGVAYRRPTDPREVLISEPTPVNVRDLVETLEEISWNETGISTTLSFVLEAPPDSVLAWYLKGFGMARRVDRLEDLPADELGSIVVTTGGEEATMSPPDGAYVGQDFPLRSRWSPRAMGCQFWEPGCSVAMEWYLFRDGVPLPEPESWAVVWRRGGISHSD
jgi:uncharacterized protein (TIGR03663 family)